MKEFLAKLLGMFKANNIELTPEQIADLNADILKATAPPAPAKDFKLPDINHNADAVNQVVAQFNAQMTEQQKKFEETITAMNKQNEDLLKALGEERQQRENGMKALEEKQKAEKDAKILGVLTEMKKDGRLPPQNADLEAKYKAMFENDYDTTLAIADAMPKTTPPAQPGGQQIQGNNGTTATPDPQLGTLLTPQSLKELESTPLVKQM